MKFPLCVKDFPGYDGVELILTPFCFVLFCLFVFLFDLFYPNL